MRHSGCNLFTQGRAGQHDSNLLLYQQADDCLKSITRHPEKHLLSTP